MLHFGDPAAAYRRRSSPASLAAAPSPVEVMAQSNTTEFGMERSLPGISGEVALSCTNAGRGGRWTSPELSLGATTEPGRRLVQAHYPEVTMEILSDVVGYCLSGGKIGAVLAGSYGCTTMYAAVAAVRAKPATRRHAAERVLAMLTQRRTCRRVCCTTTR